MGVGVKSGPATGLIPRFFISDASSFMHPVVEPGWDDIKIRNYLIS